MGKKLSDRIPYLEKRDKLEVSVGSVYNCQSDCYVVALSRRAPRFLEKIFDTEERAHQEREELNTVTELALPFLYHQLAELAKMEGSGVQLPTIHIVDDAVYYGSTLEGLWNEMAMYEQLYQLEGRIQHPVHVCIKSKRSKPLKELNIAEDTKVDDGFEHYFVKNLTADLRSLHKALEVEYPIVTYHFEEVVDIEKLIERIISVYGKERAYRIDYPDNTEGSSCRDDIHCVSVVLDDGNAIFKKMRFSMTDHDVRISLMGPRNIHVSFFSLSLMFLNTEVNDVWKWAVSVPNAMVDLATSHNGVASSYNTLTHNVMKSLVVLANYFYSYNILIEQKETLASIFTSLGYNAEFQGVDVKDVFYLMANKKRAHEIKCIFEKLYVTGKPLEPHTQNVGDINIDYQVFEDNFPDGLIENVNIQDRRLLGRCENLSEKLSAVFYNQTLLLDNATRGLNKKDDNTRLRFGQTFDALFRNVLDEDREDKLAIHRWIDRSIDMGCIVPQYVQDSKSHYWTRVFRPGENEDVILGQLSRFAVFCFKCIDDVVGAGWLQEDTLSDMLSVVFLKSEYNLSRELGIRLGIKDRILTFATEESDEPTDLLAYLKRMNIFEGDGSDLQVGSGMEYYDIGRFTSMGVEIDNDIRQLIEHILNRADDEGLSVFDTYYYTNLFFVNTETYSHLSETVRKAHGHILRLVEDLERTEDRRSLLEAERSRDLNVNFFALDKLLVKPGFWKEFEDKEGFAQPEFETLERYIINYEMLVDMMDVLILKEDDESYDDIADSILDYYRDSSWGSGVLYEDRLHDVERIFKDADMSQKDKELALLKVCRQSFQSLKI